MIPIAAVARFAGPHERAGRTARIPGAACRRGRRSATRWRHGCIPTIAAYRPGRAAKKVAMPILFCVSNTDTVTPPAQTLRYARTAPRGEIKRYDAGHFDFYTGETFESPGRATRPSS